MSTLRNLALALVSFATLTTLVPAADTTSFKVDSYIPVLFRDMQWTLNGQAELNGVGNHAYNAPGDDQYNSTTSSHARTFSASSDWRKVYVTRPLSWNLGLLASFNYNGEENERGSDVHTAYRLGYSHDSTSMNTGRYFLRMAGSVRPYVSGDLFFTVSGDLSVNISKMYDANGVGASHSIDSSYANNMVTYDRSYIREANGTDESYSYSATVGAGWGRVYYGNYAATALYMIEELKNHGQLKSLPDRPVMDSMTELVYQFRMAHAIDSRLRRIEAINAISAFLRAHGITEMADPIAGLYLQDVWDYFPADTRRFGFMVQASAGVRDNRSWHGSGQRESYSDSYIVRVINSDSVVESYINNADYSTESHYSTSYNSPIISGSVSYYQPISLRTQLDAVATGNYYLDPTSKYSYSTHVTEHTCDVSCDVSLNYIFSSRTRGRLDAGAVYATTQSVTYDRYSYPDNFNRNRDDMANFTLSGGLQYRIAIPTTLTGTLRYRAYKENSRYYYDYLTPRSSGHEFTLSISITHALY